MPFLHWFKRKSESNKTETKPLLAEELAKAKANTPEAVGADLQQESGPQTLPNEEQPADVQPIPQDPVVASEGAADETPPPPATPDISVAIGAFYAQLPAHLLAPKKPDLTHSVQIAEGDVVVNQETQEATLPLSILSLSCPELFIRAVEGSEDVPVTFSLNHPKELAPPPTGDSIPLEQSEGPWSTAVAAPDSEDGSIEVNGPAESGENEIRLRLQPILIDFPPQLEPPLIHSLIGTPAEIGLPLDLIRSQLEYGRVVIPAEIFCRALPVDLKPYFEGIAPDAEIPIPLQEVFSRLPVEAIKRREDQEIDQEETIETPFSAHAEEDAQRFSQVPAGETPPSVGLPQPKAEPTNVGIESDSKRLQAIFMTDEPLDLVKTIHKIAELPGLRSCVLSTIDGLKLAGNLGDPDQEEATFALLPELFQATQSKSNALGAGTLETITLHYGLQQLSTFVQGKLCLTVLHDNRPFKPGVREKIQAVISELAALSAAEKPL